MFYPFYKSIKDRIADQVKAMKDTQWFNDQYSSTIHAEPITFIEFPEIINFKGISKETDRSEISVTIHVVSKAMADNDASISDTQVKEHDDLAILVRDSLKSYQLTYGGSSLGTKLQLTGYQAAHQYKGWLVIKIFYTTKQIS
jgi:hypothetical protein